MRTSLILVECIVLLGAAAYARQGVLARYPLDSNPNDITGQLGPMKLVNTPFQDGGIYCNGVYQYSGDANWCAASTPRIRISGLQAFSIQAKFRVTQYGMNHLFLAGHPSGDYNDGWFDFFLMGDSTVAMYNSDSYSFSRSAIRYSINTWHEATISYDTTTKIAKFYLDARLAGTVHLTGKRPDTISVEITNYGWSNAVFHGSLSELRISSIAVIPTALVNPQATCPDVFELFQNYPNPFNPSSTIRYAIPTASQVSLKIYSVIGVEVATLVSSYQQPGFHEIRWSSSVPSGVYIYKLQAGSYVQSRKMILMK